MTVPGKTACDDIFFNSKSKDYAELSNFYGGVEARYMKQRFGDSRMRALFDAFEASTPETFKGFLKALQPGKVWTDRKLQYWFRKGAPIRGILSKLAGKSVTASANSKTMRQRLYNLKKLAGMDMASECAINGALSSTDKEALMLECLREKYAIPYYRDLLLSTGKARLHEKPMRGKGGYWTLHVSEDGTTTGDDRLGVLLMRIRDELCE